MSTTWIIVLIAVALAAVYFLVIRKRGPRPGMPVAAPAKGPSKKSRWRRALGSVGSIAKAVPGVSMVPGVSQAMSIGGSLGIM